MDLFYGRFAALVVTVGAPMGGEENTVSSRLVRKEKKWGKVGKRLTLFERV